MDSYIELRFVPLTHLLFIRVTARYEEIVETISQTLPKIYHYLQMRHVQPTGPPCARYVNWCEESCDIEIGVPVPMEMEGLGEIQYGEIGNCEAGFAIHTGSYDGLADIHQAIRDWIDAGGQEVGGPPWEVYMAWQGTHPDPEDWKTEIYWPVA